MKRTTHAALALLAISAAMAACSDSPTQGGNVERATVHAAINNSNGQAVMFDQHNASLQVGYGVLIEVHITDAAGKPISGARPTWSTTSASIATVVALPDSGFTSDGARASVGARAPGTVMIIAKYNDVADTVHFTVEAGAGPSGNPPPTNRPTSFDVTVRAVGFTGGADSSKWVFTPVPGTVITFIQLPPAQYDTLPPAVTPVSVPTVRGTGTADANGLVAFQGMPAARYRLDVKTPDASVWASRTVDYYPPYLSSFRMDVLLQKK